MYEIVISQDNLTDNDKAGEKDNVFNLWPLTIYRVNLQYTLTMKSSKFAVYRLNIEQIIAQNKVFKSLLYDISYGGYYSQNEYGDPDDPVEELRLIKEEARRLLNEYIVSS